MMRGISFRTSGSSGATSRTAALVFIVTLVAFATWVLMDAPTASASEASGLVTGLAGGSTHSETPIAARAGVIGFSPAHSRVNEFQHFWVDVVIDADVIGVTGYDLAVDFDESLISVVDVLEGDLPAGYSGETFFYWTASGTPSDALVVNGAVLGGSVDGPGSLVRIEFEALEVGVSPLAFTSVQLRDINNEPISVVEGDGDVEIEAVGRIYIDPSYASVPEDSTACLVDVAIDSLVEGLTGFHLLLDFDENLLTPVDVIPAELMTSYGGDTALYWSTDGQPSDALLIDGAFLGGSVDGAGPLVTLCFHATTAGLTQLEFLVAELRDLDNNDIPAGSIPGVIEVTTGGTAVEKATWSAIKGRFR